MVMAIISYEILSTDDKFTQTHAALRGPCGHLSCLLINLKAHNYKSDLSVYMYVVVDNTALSRVQHGEKLGCAVADSS